MTLGEAQTTYAALVAMGEATVALTRARDLLQLIFGGAQAAASLDVLALAATALVMEMGAMLAAERDSEDAATRDFVRLLLARLHGPVADEAAPPEPAEERQ